MPAIEELQANKDIHTGWESKFTEGLLSMETKGDVFYLQQLLNQYDSTGNPLRIDGVYNKRTQNGVRLLLKTVMKDKDDAYINKVLRQMKINMELQPYDVMKKLKEV